MSTLTGVLRRRFDGTNEVDEWGFDADIGALVQPVASWRWSVAVGGMAHVPTSGPALLVMNDRLLGFSPLLVAHVVGGAAGRPLRFTGIPDIAPLGPLLRRLGGVLARPDEVEGLLRAGQLVGVTLSTAWRRPERAGRAPVELLAPAATLKVPILPVGVSGNPLGRRWRVEVGPPLRPGRRRGPLELAELADAARAGVQRVLDETD